MKKVISYLFAATMFAAVATAEESETFGGFGISVWPSGNGAKIAGVMPGLPADGVGLQVGDVIVSVDGNSLSAFKPGEQTNYLRGKAGTTANLVVNRNGEMISVSAKRVGISVQSLDASEISQWYGKDEGLTAEEVSYLASKKTAEGYEFHGIMQYGTPVPSSAENLRAQNFTLLSVQKAETKPLAKPSVEKEEPSLNGKTKDAKLVNVKGARVKNQGKAPAYKLR
ncbi:MAG: PDZ domain-containing protein [Fibromonadales bacterium]|nr:PDZ domain-containing protein [Fibromonadales bacterium]